MIKYEQENSPFFDAHKKYCEAMEQQLRAAWSGYCNSFGYKIEASIEKGKTAYHLLLEKHQTTQNGIVVPVDANEYAGAVLTITGLKKEYSISISDSAVTLHFTGDKYSAYFPKPFSASFSYSPSAETLEQIANGMKQFSIASFRLKNGKLTCKIHSAIADPAALIDTMAKLALQWN